MTDERLITLVKLYNRLSFYFCLVSDDKPIPEISEETSINELQEELNKIYEDYREFEEQEKLNRTILKSGVKFLRNSKSNNTNQEIKEDSIEQNIIDKEPAEDTLIEQPKIKKIKVIRTVSLF